jgi:hypothetical protein
MGGNPIVLCRSRIWIGHESDGRAVLSCENARLSQARVGFPKESRASGNPDDLMSCADAQKATETAGVVVESRLRPNIAVDLR